MSNLILFFFTNMIFFEKKEGEMSDTAGFIIFMTIGMLCYHLIFDKDDKEK